MDAQILNLPVRISDFVQMSPKLSIDGSRYWLQNNSKQFVLDNFEIEVLTFFYAFDFSIRSVRTYYGW